MDNINFDLNEEQIQKILTTYKNKRIRENKYYHEVSKNCVEFCEKNRQRAKAHYDKTGKDKKKEKYESNKDLLKAKSLYNYYKKNNKIDKFIENKPNEYQLLVDSNFIKE
tara:strand:+ start:7770 stop:8099 length:330 start_codon:yes stop_codon:yes gene_type:complete